MVRIKHSEVSYKNGAKSAFSSLLHQTGCIFIGWIAILLITQGRPSSFTVFSSFMLGIAYVAWSEQRRLKQISRLQTNLGESKDLITIKSFDEHVINNTAKETEYSFNDGNFALDTTGPFSVDKLMLYAEKIVLDASGKHLFSSNIDRIVFEGILKGKKYSEIADENGFTYEYINSNVGYRLLKNLSSALGQRVKKTSFRENLSHAIMSQGSSLFNLPIYVERPLIETSIYQELLKPGALVRIKAPHGMGKTSMMNWLLVSVKEKQNFHIFSLSFKKFHKSTIGDLDDLLRTLCFYISHKLQLDPTIDEYWEMELGSISTCTLFFEEHILPNINQPLVLAFDDVDFLFQCESIASDFFSMLRAWHENAQSYELWGKLRLIIAYSTDIYPNWNIYRSPFNLGILCELPDFNFQQVRQLAQLSAIDNDRVDESQISALMELVGGHPYLLQAAFRQLIFQPKLTVSELVKKASTDAEIYQDHLRSLLFQLQSEPETLAAFNTICQATVPVTISSKHSFLLKQLGLVVPEGSQVKPRNLLYRLYFKQHLSQE